MDLPPTSAPRLGGPLWLRVLVAVGGVLGAGVRLAAITAVGEHRGWLWLTIAAVNVVGCAVVGAALASAHRWSWPTHWRVAVTVGFCGGLTTFATVTLEVALAIGRGMTDAVAATGWALGSLVVGVLAVVAGHRLVGTHHPAPTSVTSTESRRQVDPR